MLRLKGVEDFVQDNVKQNVTRLVATLATGLTFGRSDLATLAEQAQELGSPVLDYEEACREAGWSVEETTHEGSGSWYAYRIEDGIKKIGSGQFETQAEAWQDLCEAQEIDPDEREVYEFWTVSETLAEKLVKHGEKVDRDFAGLNVWARTTTGQAIYLDNVIQKIWYEIV